MDKWLDQIKGRWQGRTKNGASSQPSKPNDLGKKLMDIVREKGYYTLNIETFGENTIVALPHLYDPDYKQKPLFHVHNYFEMVYVYHGSCVHVTHDETIHLHQGDVLLMNPHILHWLYTEHPTDIVFNILLSKDFLEQTVFPWMTDNRLMFNFFLDYFYHLNQVEDFILFPYTEKYPVESLIKQLIEEYVNDDLCCDSALKGICLQLFAHLARICNDYYAANDADMKNHQVAIRIIQYIQTHLDTISLESVAKEFNYSTSHISRLFRKSLGKSYSEVVYNIKLQTAKKLLETTSLSMGDIADNIGVNDTSYLHRIFKKKYGLSPSEYRKQMQKSIDEG